tara:strand:- start:143 stop:580 length:438 start_codon:yes stop_codon:yes gene_type:complete
MADVKISALTEQTVPVSDDVLVMVETATTTNKKVEIGNIIRGRADVIIAVTASTKTFALSDANTFQRLNSSSAQTITVPANGTVAFPTGTRITMVRQGTGTPTIAAAAGVTLWSASSNVDVSPRYGVATLTKLSSNIWVLFGDLA